MKRQRVSELISTQALVMLDLQAKMNSKVAPNWLEVRFPYLRAVVIEAAEAIEHHGWKWWKKQDCDMPQLQMEIVDIWHFLLSELLIETQGDQSAAIARLLEVNVQSTDAVDLVFDGRAYCLAEMDLLGKLELLIGISAARRIELHLFKAIMLDCDMDWDALFKQYVSKNVLNFFRQDNGYREGNYQKIWQGKEDNEHLVEIMIMLDSQDPTYPESLYSMLTERYPASV